MFKYRRLVQKITKNSKELGFEKDDLPNGWTNIKFQKIVKKIPLTGKKLKQKEYQKSGKLPIVDQGYNFIGGFTDKIKQKVDCNLPVIVFGDHTKNIKFVNQDFVAGADGIKVLEPIVEVSPKLVYYFIQAISLPDKGYARHYQYLEKSIIRMPPLNEQKRIVKKIESIFTQIDAVQKKLEVLASQIKSSSNSLNMLKNSILKQIFEKEVIEEYRLFKLKECIENFEKRNPKDTPNLSFKYVEIGGVGDNKKITDFKNLFGCDAPSRARNVIRTKDVIYGTTRPYYRNVVLIPSEFNNEVCSTGFCVLRSKNSMLLPDYLFYYMLSDIANNQILKSMRGGNYPAVSNKDVIDINISLPILSIQKRIVSKIESIFGRIDAEKEKMKKIEMQLKSVPDSINALKNSILKQAFDGRLVPQDPNDEHASVLLEKIKSQKFKI